MAFLNLNWITRKCHDESIAVECKKAAKTSTIDVGQRKVAKKESRKLEKFFPFAFPWKNSSSNPTSQLVELFSTSAFTFSLSYHFEGILHAPNEVIFHELRLYFRDSLWLFPFPAKFSLFSCARLVLKTGKLLLPPNFHLRTKAGKVSGKG